VEECRSSSRSTAWEIEEEGEPRGRKEFSSELLNICFQSGTAPDILNLQQVLGSM